MAKGGSSMNEVHPEITADPLLRIESIGPDGGAFEPRSADEIERWLDKEAEFWRWLREPVRNEQPHKPMRNKQFFAEDEIRQNLAAFKANPQGNQGALGVVEQRIRSRYVSELAIHSSSPRAAFIANIASRDPLLAAVTAYVLIGSDPPAFDRRGVAATALAAAYNHGLTTSPKHFEEPMRSALREIETDRGRLVLAAGDANDEWNTQRTKITTLHTEQSKTFDEQQAARQTEFSKLLAEHEKKVGDIRDSLSKDMALKAAVTYFRDKAKSHERKATGFTLISLGVGGGVIALAFMIAKYVFGGTGTATPVQIGLTVICGFLVLWLLRLLVRMLLSNLHIATDLQNRATLVQSYLALIAEGGALGDKDRAQIVALVFRPVIDGLVRDDGAPPTVFSLLQEAATGRGRN
jgi:hypothetical protein